VTATTVWGDGWRETHTGKWHYYPGDERRRGLLAVCLSDNGGVGPHVPDHAPSEKDCKSCRRYVDRSVK